MFVSKYKFGKILPQQSKVWNFALRWTFFVKIILRFSWRITEDVSLITLKSDAKFKEKLTWFQIRYEEFGEFSPNCSKVQKFHFDGLFLCKVYEVSAKEIQKSIFHDTEQWCKICVTPNHEELGELSLEHSKSEKLFIDGVFLSKAYNVTARKFRYGDAKFKGKLTCGLKNDIRNLVNFHASSPKSGNLHFDWILLSKAYKDLDEKIQKSYVSWHWRVSKVWRKTDSWFQKWHEEFGEF